MANGLPAAEARVLAPRSTQRADAIRDQFHDLGPDFYATRIDPDRRKRNHIRPLGALGTESEDHLQRRPAH